ncbi:hypothetical protein T01_14702 [Trichinella spiralis]|uniref:Uncharacterized protein n=1 Tax=Trichinella spiralis TaxID=6334 RepID=A0A0V1AVK1_TRISP|nr:hypothetical protein T01_14702 [Trichinella spiralis]
MSSNAHVWVAEELAKLGRRACVSGATWWRFSPVGEKGGEAFSGATTTAHWRYETKEGRCDGTCGGSVALRDEEASKASPGNRANSPTNRQTSWKLLLRLL